MTNLNLKEKLNNKNGITLVALVISIIILLILATVSISLIINSGIINKAKYGVDKYSEKEELEQIKLAVLSAQMKNKGTLTTENLNSELQANLNDNITMAEKIGSKWYYNGYLIDENGNVEKYDKLLPNEYQQVEYIESTGTQYIDTDLVSSKNVFEYSAEVSATQLTGTGQQILFGATNGFYVTIMSKIYRATSKCITNIRINIDKFDKINLISNPIDSKLKLTINDITKTATYTNFVMNEKIGIFGYANGICKAKCRIKKLKISIDGEDRADFIPCYSVTNVTNSDNIQCSSGTIGMYDIVEGKFYTNQGTGEFIAGPNVNE